jgi:hypothetical protein
VEDVTEAYLNPGKRQPKRSKTIVNGSGSDGDSYSSTSGDRGDGGTSGGDSDSGDSNGNEGASGGEHGGGDGGDGGGGEHGGGGGGAGGGRDGGSGGGSGGGGGGGGGSHGGACNDHLSSIATHAVCVEQLDLVCAKVAEMEMLEEFNRTVADLVETEEGYRETVKTPITLGMIRVCAPMWQVPGASGPPRSACAVRRRARASSPCTCFRRCPTHPSFGPLRAGTRPIPAHPPPPPPPTTTTTTTTTPPPCAGAAWSHPGYLRVQTRGGLQA